MRIPPIIKKNPLVVVGAAAAALLGLVFLSRRSGSGGNGSASSPTLAVGPGDRVLLIGDSLAVGLTKPMQALADAQGIVFRGHAEVGTRIDQWDGGARWDAALQGFSPTVVVISLGTNDFKMFDPATQQAGHITGLLQKIRDLGARSAWIIPPTMPFPDKGLRQAIADAGPDLALHAEQIVNIPRAEDKIHYTPSGYTMFAQALWSCLTLQACDYTNSSYGPEQ